MEREKAKSWRAGHDVGYRSGQRHFQRELRAIFGIKQPDDDD